MLRFCFFFFFGGGGVGRGLRFRVYGGGGVNRVAVWQTTETVPCCQPVLILRSTLWLQMRGSPKSGSTILSSETCLLAHMRTERKGSVSRTGSLGKALPLHHPDIGTAVTPHLLDAPF